VRNSFVSLYVDGEWTAKQHINVLEAGETRELTFIVKPKSGKHEVTVKVDDPRTRTCGIE